MTETLTVSAAAAALAAARATRDGLIAAAIAGAPVDLAAHRAAVEAIDAAAQDVALAEAVAEGTRLAGERARIAALAAEADRLKAALRRAVAADAEAAAALDAAVTAAQEAAARWRATAEALLQLDLAAVRHGEAVAAEARGNATLGAIHASVRPKVRSAGVWSVPAHPVDVRLTMPQHAARAGQLAGGAPCVAISRSAASLAAGAHQAVLAAIGDAPEAA